MTRLTTASTWFAVILWCSMLSAAGDEVKPNRTEAETTLTLFAKPVSKRLVVAGEDGRFDVWLYSKQPFSKTSARLQGAAAVKLTLPGGFSLTRASWVDASHRWWVELVRRNERTRIVAMAYGQGSLFILRGAGDRREAAAWSPRYRPDALPLKHGSLCAPSTSGL